MELRADPESWVPCEAELKAEDALATSELACEAGDALATSELACGAEDEAELCGDELKAEDEFTVEDEDGPVVELEAG